MDTSELFIKLCEKAEEIQGVWNPEDGDFYVDMYSAPAGTESNHVEISHCCPCADEDGRGTTEAVPMGRDIWLPRQDQLQEMVFNGSLLNLLYDFQSFVKLNQLPSYAACFTSMEQLWLAFVMKEKYNKIWSGTEWIKHK